MLVFDATPLIYLARTEKLEELGKLKEQKIVPEKVYEEVVVEGRKQGEPDAEKVKKAVEDGIFEVESTETVSTELENSCLSGPDIAVLGLSRERNATAVIDEEYGRNIADAEGIETRGTAYLVFQLLRNDVITAGEARDTIDQMIDEGWYCSTDLYKEILNKIKELEK